MSDIWGKILHPEYKYWIVERTPMKTSVKDKISMLESQGYKVHIKHERSGPFDCPNPTGGQTRAIIKDGFNGEVAAAAIAKCSEQDNYNKKIGANIALGRAIHMLFDEQPLSVNVPEWENPEIIKMQNKGKYD